jgi:hypothetical protein
MVLSAGIDVETGSGIFKMAAVLSRYNAEVMSQSGTFQARAAATENASVERATLLSCQNEAAAMSYWRPDTC